MTFLNIEIGQVLVDFPNVLVISTQQLLLPGSTVILSHISRNLVFWQGILVSRVWLMQFKTALSSAGIVHAT